MLETGLTSRPAPQEQTSTGRARRRRGGSRWSTPLAWAVTVVVMLPLAWIVLLSFQTGQAVSTSPLDLSSLTVANYAHVFDTLPLARMYGNTILLAVTSVAIGVTTSYLASVALSIMVFKHRRWQSALRYYVLLGLAVPVYILLFPVYRLVLEIGLYGSYWSLILPYAAISIPFNTLLLTGFLRDVPQEIIDAAIVDGVGLPRLCWSVVLPIVRPVIATVLIFNVIYVFNEFPFVSILISDRSRSTLSLAVSQFQGQYSVDYGAMMAATVMILVPQLLIYVLFQRQVVAGMTLGAVKG